MPRKSKLEYLKDELEQELSEARADRIRKDEVADMRIAMLEAMIERIKKFNGKEIK